MKRFLALAALVLGLAACQTEPEGLDVIVGGEVDTVVSVSLPEATRANSAEGFNLGTLGEEYKLRYILEIYRVENGITDLNTCQRHTTFATNANSVSFPVRLAPDRDYTFVAWADLADKDATKPSEADRCYNTQEGLGNITIVDNTWNAMDESRDAFTAKETKTGFSAQAVDLHLKRPFAKLRVVATDYEDVVNLGLTPASAVVTYSQKMPCKYNALAQEVTEVEATKRTHTITYDVNNHVYNDTVGFTLFADYFFADNNHNIAKFSLNVYADANKEKLIKANNFNTEIFVEANKLTTIKGDVLTIGGNVSIVIENGLGELETINYADNAETLQEIINAAPADGEQTNITLGGNIDLSDLLNAGIFSTRSNEPTYGLLIPADKSIVLDLNGHTISQSKAQTSAYAMIDNKGTLTIEDSSANKSGKIAYGDTGNGGNYVSNTISNSGVLTIKGGTIENNSSATVASNGYPHPIDNSGVLTINGGTFKNNANYSSMRIWCTTDDDTIVTINDGTFYGSIDFQTPNASANKGTLTINGGTFNADTYTNCTVRLLGFGADVDEMNGYIKGGVFNGAIALRNWSGSDFNSKVFNITGGTFTVDPSEFVDDDYAVIENNGVYTLALKSVIAKIGETEYRSLQKAFDAVAENEKILLIGDVTLNKTATFAEGKTAILDLNNFAISSSCHKSVGAAIKNNGTLTVMNGTIKSLAENGGSTIQNNGVMTVSNATLNGAINANGSWPSYTVNNTGSLTINNTLITSYHGAVASYGEDAIVTLNESTIDMNGIAGFTSHGIYTYNSGKAVVNGGTYTNKATDQNSTGGSVINGAIEVNAGVFTGRLENYYGNPVLKGGTFSVKPNDKFIADGHHTIEKEDGTWEVKLTPVAMIGETEYFTLQEAFNAVNGETIVLYSNTTLNETVTLAEGKTAVLDLNGKTLSAADNNVIKNIGGNLTIKNGTVTRTGDVVGYSVNNASGEITVENATIKRGLYTSGSKMTATNANISHEQSSRHAIYAWDCEVTINSGTYHNDNAGNATLMASGSSVVTINGGTFSIADGRSSIGWTSCMIDQNGTANVTVKGGLFNGGFRINSADTTLTIEGGEFNTNNGSGYTDYSGTKVVKGGKFTDNGAQNWAKKYIADGYEMNANGEVVAK